MEHGEWRSHSAADVGAAESGHYHTGGASDAELARKFGELQVAVNKLAIALETERRLNAELRAGAVTVPALVSAIRMHAQYTQDDVVSFALDGLADTIEREAGR